MEKGLLRETDIKNQGKAFTQRAQAGAQSSQRRNYGALAISMLPLESVSWSWQPPEPRLFSTVRFPAMRSTETLRKLVLAKVSLPISVSVMAPFPVMARTPLGISNASIEPKEDLSSAVPCTERTEILPLLVSALSEPEMLSSSRAPKESRMVTEGPVAAVPLTRPLLVVQLTRPFTSEKVMLPKLLVMSRAPAMAETSTLPLLS